MNRETDTVFLQTLGRFIQAQVQLAVTPLMQVVSEQAKTIAQLSADKNLMIKELDGAIEGFAAEIARVETLISEPVTIRGLDGKDGIDGKDGKDGLNGENGKDGPAGRDGADVVAAFRDSDGHLVLTLSNGVTKDVGLIHGRDGKDGLPGKDGLDGLGFKDMSAVWDGERTLIFKFVLEDRVEEMSVTIPIVLYRGAWTRGKQYQQGDNVIWEGSSWIAIRDTDKQPGTADRSDTGWVMAVRRGRDGDDGKQGKAGPEGKAGRDGRDLTQMGFDGKKW